MMTLNELIGFMSPELANEILEDTYAQDKLLYKSISAEVAAALKLRPAFFEQKARKERNKIILDMLTRPANAGQRRDSVEGLAGEVRSADAERFSRHARHSAQGRSGGGFPRDNRRVEIERSVWTSCWQSIRRKKCCFT
jgi:hypothetical protein